MTRVNQTRADWINAQKMGLVFAIVFGVCVGATLIAVLALGVGLVFLGALQAVGLSMVTWVVSFLAGFMLSKKTAKRQAEELFVKAQSMTFLDADEG